MGVITVPQQSNHIADYLRQWWMAEGQNEAVRREEQARADQFRAQQYANLPDDAKRKMYSTLDPGVRRYLIDPSMVPERELSAGERAAALADQHRLNALTKYQPDGFNTDYLATEAILGRSPNAQWTEVNRDRHYMGAEQFRTYANEGFVAPSEVARRAAEANRANADADFTRGPKTVTEQRQGALYGAQAGEAAARTGKVREETITEVQMRDPKSGAVRARTAAGGHLQPSRDEHQLKYVQQVLVRIREEELKVMQKLAAAQVSGNTTEAKNLQAAFDRLNGNRRQVQAEYERLLESVAPSSAPDPLGIR